LSGGRLRAWLPVAAEFEARDHVIGVVVRLEIEKVRREAQHPQRRRAEDRTLEAVSGPFAQDPARRPRGRREVVWQSVEKALDAVRSLQPAQPAELRGGEWERHGDILW